MKRALAVVAALCLVVGCPDPKEPKHIPGKTKKLSLVVKMADLPQSELDTIGSFVLQLVHDGAASTEIPLSFSSSSRTLELLEEPDDLPTSGTVSAILAARDVLGEPLEIGGVTGTVNLDAPDGERALFAVVSRVGDAAPLSVESDVGANVKAVAIGAGLLLVGDDGLQWLDLATGATCTSTAANDACHLGRAPPPSGAGLAVAALAGGPTGSFGASCPQRNKAVLALDGEVWLFDPAQTDADDGQALSALETGTQARTGAVLLPTKDCRVLLAGGAPQPTTVLTFRGDGVDDIDSAPGPALPTAAEGAAAASTLNAIGEALIVGGDDGGAPGGAAVVRTVGDLEVCSLTDDCNGEDMALTCARTAPVAARLADAFDLSPVLVFGGDCASPELFRSAPEAPFGAFLPVGVPDAPRRDGATLTSVAGGALLAGGVVVGGVATGQVSFFALDALGADSASGAWTDMGDLGVARSGHAAVAIGGAVVIVGGAGAEQSIEVIVPTLEPSAGGT
jgi:hypothetical protein